ncbi:amidohydrolase [Caldanaerobacter subterraneus KAk]|uniref:amidohydrolase n=1 Tax=Caldanaerobacter subterraneus TaxID=911092 RepID=UPI0032BFE5C6
MRKEQVEELVNKVKEEVVQWRRYFHQYPELSFHEEKTAQRIADILSTFEGLIISRPLPNSVVADLEGRGEKRVAIRADIDALPIQEENEFDFASKNPGVMHACGHDGHIAVLLGTAKVLSQLRKELKGNVRFIFQPAEEMPPGGAKELVERGVLQGVDFVIGEHLWTPLPVGKVGIVYGPMMASADMFTIKIIGKGGHAALPHYTVDPIAISAEVVTNLQHIVSREIDPLEPIVVTIGRISGGTTDNVIPNVVEMAGTVRLFNPGIREEISSVMERIIKGITTAHRASYEFNFKPGYAPVINNKGVVKVVEEAVKELFGEEAIVRIKPVMGGEDFSAYLERVPGTFFFVGAGNEEKGIVHPHHHPRFNIDEKALEIAVKIFVYTTFKLLSQ